MSFCQYHFKLIVTVEGVDFLFSASNYLIFPSLLIQKSGNLESCNQYLPRLSGFIGIQLEDTLCSTT